MSTINLLIPNPAAARVATSFGDVSTDQLVEYADHEVAAPIHVRDADGNLLYTDPDGNQTTDQKSLIPALVEGETARSVYNTAVTEVATVNLGAGDVQKYTVGGGRFSVDVLDQNNERMASVGQKVADLPVPILAGLFRAVAYVRVKAWNDNPEVLMRKPGAHTADYIAAIESQIASEFGLTDPHA